MKPYSFRATQAQIAQSPCVCGGSRTIYLDVPDGHPAYGVRFLCSCQIARRAATLKRMFPTSGVPSRFSSLSLDTFDALPDDAKNGKLQMLAATRRMSGALKYFECGGLVSNGHTRHGVYIYGPCGTGKTAMASIIYRSWAKIGISSLWITYADMIRSIQSGYSDHTADAKTSAIRDVELLVIDDVGRDRIGAMQSDNKTAVFDAIISHRHAHKMATVVTSNLTLEQLTQQFDERIAQRIGLEMCFPISVGGMVLRGMK